MFMNTMAVGPFEPAELCVTGGGATVALLLFQRWVHGDKTGVAGDFHVARFTACDKGERIAIEGLKEAQPRDVMGGSLSQRPDAPCE